MVLVSHRTIRNQGGVQIAANPEPDQRRSRGGEEQGYAVCQNRADEVRRFCLHFRATSVAIIVPRAIPHIRKMAD